MAQKQYKVREHPDHYEVDDGKGPFKIAKKAIPENLHTHIRKMATGGSVEDEIEPSTGAPTTEAPNVAAAVQSVGEKVFGKELPPAEPSGATGGFEYPGGAQSLEEAKAGEKAAEPTPTVSSRGKAGGPSAEQEFGEAEKKQEQAIQAQADVAKRQGAAQALLQHQSLEAQDAFNKSEDAKEAAHQAELARSIQDFKSGKINPNQLWENADFGSKASALIGIILGGVGAGMTGGPNQALGVVQKQIDRNIDAQVKNKQNQESMVNVLMRQGYDMRQARGVAEARMKDRLAGQLEASASDFAGDKAQAAAQGAVANLRASSVQIKQQMRAEGQQSVLRGLQIQSAQMGLQQQEIDRAIRVQAATGKEPDPRLIAMASPEIRKMFAPSPQEVGLTQALNVAEEEKPNALLAKVPFTAARAKREEQAGAITDYMMKLHGLTPSSRNPLYKVYHDQALNISAMDPEKQKQALESFRRAVSGSQAMRRAGFAPTAAPAAAPETEG